MVVPAKKRLDVTDEQERSLLVLQALARDLTSLSENSDPASPAWRVAVSLTCRRVGEFRLGGKCRLDSRDLLLMAQKVEKEMGC